MWTCELFSTTIHPEIENLLSRMLYINRTMLIAQLKRTLGSVDNYMNGQRYRESTTTTNVNRRQNCVRLLQVSLSCNSCSNEYIPRPQNYLLQRWSNISTRRQYSRPNVGSMRH